MKARHNLNTNPFHPLILALMRFKNYYDYSLNGLCIANYSILHFCAAGSVNCDKVCQTHNVPTFVTLSYVQGHTPATFIVFNSR